MYCSREYQTSTRLIQQYEKSTLNLNVRIAKNNLAYPLLKDTFSVLSSSRCEVLSVLELKDAFHSFRLLENLKRYCGILPYFGSASCTIKECLWDEIYHHQFGNHI